MAFYGISVHNPKKYYVICHNISRIWTFSLYSQAGQYEPEGGTALNIDRMKKTAALTLTSSTTAS